jgi:hypothetical protein
MKEIYNKIKHGSFQSYINWNNAPYQLHAQVHAERVVKSGCLKSAQTIVNRLDFADWKLEWVIRGFTFHCEHICVAKLKTVLATYDPKKLVDFIKNS